MLYSIDDIYLLAVSEGVWDSLDIKNNRDSCNDPFLRRSFCLKLSVKHISCTSGLSLVNGALIHILFFSSICRNRQWLAKNDWNDRELLLGVRFFELSHCSIPAGTFYLETEYVSTFLGRLLVIRVPVEFLLDVSLNIEFVKLLLLFSSVYLLDSSKERLRIEQSVNENDARNSCWIFFPIVQLIKALFEVIQPWSETSVRGKGMFGPGSRDLI